MTDRRPAYKPKPTPPISAQEAADLAFRITVLECERQYLSEENRRLIAKVALLQARLLGTGKGVSCPT